LPQLRASLAVALGRHPLVDSVLGDARSPGPIWRRVREAEPATAEVCDFDALGVPFDLARERPFRWYWRATAEGGMLWAYFHHAAVDGLGALSFLGDWFAAYDAVVAPQRGTRLRSLRPEMLHTRGRPTLENNRPSVGPVAAGSQPVESSPAGSVGGSAGVRPGGTWQAVREVVRFLFRRVTPVAAAAGDGGVGSRLAGESAPPLCWLRLSEVQSSGLRRTAESAGVTLNDWVMRALLEALLRWNRQRDRPGRWYRIMMPVNLRDRQQQRMPAANRIGFAFIDRDLTRCGDREALLRGLAEENAFIRGTGITTLFLQSLDTALRIPGAMRLLTRGGGAGATAVLSNVGDPTRRFHSKLSTARGRLRVGQLVLEEFAGAPPTRPGTNASFLLSQYAGEVTLSVTYARGVLGRESAERLLGYWRDSLLESLGRVGHARGAAVAAGEGGP
jgi:hypothetical protein